MARSIFIEVSWIRHYDDMSDSRAGLHHCSLVEQCPSHFSHAVDETIVRVVQREYIEATFREFYLLWVP
jgi:hypothetical protein